MTNIELFNKSHFSEFIKTPKGRIISIVSVTSLLTIGYLYRKRSTGVLSIMVGMLPLSAGISDIFYVSAALAGLLSGKKIRRMKLRST